MAKRTLWRCHVFELEVSGWRRWESDDDHSEYITKSYIIRAANYKAALELANISVKRFACVQQVVLHFLEHELVDRD